MARSEIIVGLDVGTTKVCAVVGEVTRNGVDLVGHGEAACQGLKKGVVVDVEATVAAIEEAVDQAQGVTGFQIRSVAVGVTGQHIESLNSRGQLAVPKFRDITEEDVENVIAAAGQVPLAAGREVIHNIPRVFAVDGHTGIRRPIGMSGATLEVETHVVTAQSSFLHNVVKCVHQANLAVIPGGVILEPLATAEAVLTPDEVELGVALVDIGGGTTDVALFRGGSVFHCGVIPVGGNHVTNDLSVGLRVGCPEAERIKLEHGTALEEGIDELEAVTVRTVGQPEDAPGERIPRRIIAEIIQPRMEELFELVGQQIEQAGAAGQLPAGLVLSGGGSQLPGTLEVAGEVLEMPVRLGSPRHPAAATGPLGNPKYATGVGLVLYVARHRRVPAAADGYLWNLILARLRRGLRRLFS